MIVGFRDKALEELWVKRRSAKIDAQLRSRVLGRLVALEAATKLSSLNLPGYDLHALTKDRAGQHSIRVSGAWTICFVWTDVGPDRLELVQYH